MLRLSSRICATFGGLAVFLWLTPAAGGVIDFGLHAAGTTLAITNNGDSAAYDPKVFALRSDGDWRPLSLARKSDFDWRRGEPRIFVQPSEDTGRDRRIASLGVLMLSFFDQAGAPFNQLAFVHPPPRSDRISDAGYSAGRLYVRPPEKRRHIAATWVVWPQQEGIASLGQRPAPPRPRYIRWADAHGTVWIDTGQSRPSAYLVHEIVADHGSSLVLQVVPGKAIAEPEQRAHWLNEGAPLARTGLVLAAAAVILLLAGLWAGRRR